MLALGNQRLAQDLGDIAPLVAEFAVAGGAVKGVSYARRAATAHPRVLRPIQAGERTGHSVVTPENWTTFFKGFDSIQFA